MNIKLGNGSILVGTCADGNGGEIYFFTGGRGIIGDKMRKYYIDGETELGKISFSNVKSLDVVLRKLENLRKRMLEHDA